MELPFEPNKPYLNWLTILVGAVIFLPFYIFPNWHHSDNVLSLLHLPFYLVSWFFFSSVFAYFTTTFTTLTLGLVALRWGAIGRLMRMATVIVILLVLLYPLAFNIILPYSPPVKAAPGYQMVVPTQPGFLGSVIKQSQNIAEIKPCEYKLRGWSDDSQHFSYVVTCSNRLRHFSYTYTITPPELSRGLDDGTNQTIIAKDDVMDLLHGEDPIHLKSEGYISPDGQWVAFITQHIYGPEDVVLLKLQ